MVGPGTIMAICYIVGFGTAMNLGFAANDFPDISGIPNPVESEDNRRIRVQKAHDSRFAAILADKKFNKKEA